MKKNFATQFLTTSYLLVYVHYRIDFVKAIGKPQHISWLVSTQKLVSLQIDCNKVMFVLTENCRWSVRADVSEQMRLCSCVVQMQGLRPVATVEAEEALASSLLSLPQMPPRFSNVPPRFSHQKKLLILGCIEETEFILVVHIGVCLLLPSA